MKNWEPDKKKDFRRSSANGDYDRNIGYNKGGQGYEYGRVFGNGMTPTASSSASCGDSRECAVGWICSNGKCVDPGGKNAGGSYSSSGGGASSGTSRPPSAGSGQGGGLSSGCGSGGSGSNKGCNSPASDCTKTNCGNSGNAFDCCGNERCCRATAFGVQCSCGACGEPEKTCSTFCSNFRNSLGRSFPGCDEEVECDECEECRNVDTGTGTGIETKCVAKENAPCWCEQSGCDGTCEQCGRNGVCGYGGENCFRCWDKYYDCSCGKVKGRQCSDGSGQAPDCDSACPPDPCAGECVGVSWCEGDQPEPPCPPETTCTGSGSISAGGRTCYVRTDCNKSNVPASCKECDCNCNNDCPDCKICNGAGKCVDDPECDEYAYFVEYAWYSLEYEMQWTQSNGCQGGETQYGNVHFVYRSNRGKVGEDAMGTSWSITTNADCPACTICPGLGQEAGRNSEGYVVFPDGTKSIVKELSFCTCTSSFTPRNVFYATGITVGLGRTPNAAACDALARNPKLNITCN